MFARQPPIMASWKLLNLMLAQLLWDLRTLTLLKLDETDGAISMKHE